MAVTCVCVYVCVRACVLGWKWKLGERVWRGETTGSARVGGVGGVQGV